jgi:hypothetical protein
MILIECPKLRQFGEIKRVCKRLDFGGIFGLQATGILISCIGVAHLYDCNSIQ